MKLKKMSLRFEFILAPVSLYSGFDLNTVRPVNIRIQCIVRIGVLGLVVCFFFNFCKYILVALQTVSF